MLPVANTEVQPPKFTFAISRNFKCTVEFRAPSLPIASTDANFILQVEELGRNNYTTSGGVGTPVYHTVSLLYNS